MVSKYLNIAFFFQVSFSDVLILYTAIVYIYIYIVNKHSSAFRKFYVADYESYKNLMVTTYATSLRLSLLTWISYTCQPCIQCNTSSNVLIRLWSVSRTRGRSVPCQQTTNRNATAATSSNAGAPSVANFISNTRVHFHRREYYLEYTSALSSSQTLSRIHESIVIVANIISNTRVHYHPSHT